MVASLFRRAVTRAGRTRTDDTLRAAIGQDFRNISNAVFNPDRTQSFIREAAWGAVKGAGAYTFGSALQSAGEQVNDAYGGVLGGAAQLGGFVSGAGFKLGGYRAAGRGILRGAHRAAVGPARFAGYLPAGDTSRHIKGRFGVHLRNKQTPIRENYIGGKREAFGRGAGPTHRRNPASRLTGRLMDSYDKWLYQKPRELMYGKGRYKQTGGTPTNMLANLVQRTPEPFRGVVGGLTAAGRVGGLVGKGLYRGAKFAAVDVPHGMLGLGGAALGGTMDAFRRNAPGYMGRLANVRHPIAGAIGAGGIFGGASAIVSSQNERQRGWTGPGPHGMDWMSRAIGGNTGIRPQNYGGGISLSTNTSRRSISLGSQAVSQRMAFGGRA